MRALFFSLLTFLLFATAANAQVEALALNSTTLDKKAKATTSKAYIHGQKVLTESSDERNTIMLFDAEQETFYIINHKNRSYTEMSREDMESLSTMLREQMEQLEQQMAMLPEAQRAAVRKQMSAALGQQQHEPLEYEKEATDSRVKDWQTTKYVGMAGEQKKSEIHLASYEELGQDKKDFEALEKFMSMMQDFAQTMSRNMPAGNFGFFSEDMPLFQDGIPVKTILYDEQGEPMSTSTINSIEKEEVDEAIFRIPENYKKQQLAGELR